MKKRSLMFKKCCLLFSIFCVSQLSAEVYPLEDSNAQVGRYQISTVENNDINFVYLLDTQTGSIWESHQKYMSNKFTEWKQLPLIPVFDIIKH